MPKARQTRVEPGCRDLNCIRRSVAWRVPWLVFAQSVAAADRDDSANSVFFGRLRLRCINLRVAGDEAQDSVPEPLP